MVDDETKTIVLLYFITKDMQMELCGLLEFQTTKTIINGYQKMIVLYHPKESELSPYVKLFSHKQKMNQTTRDFLAEIRREGYRLLKDLDPGEREERMIEAFCDGLYNEEVRKALRHRRLITLEDAYNLIKREKTAEQTEEHGGAIRRVAADVSRDKHQQLTEIEKLQNQVAMTQKQLNHLISLV